VALLQPFWGTPGRDAGLGAALLFTGVPALVMDAGIFAAHYLQHKVPALWEFHKVNHSAEVMTPITVYRMHPVDDLLSGTFVGLQTGAVHGVFALTYADGIGEITVLEVNVLLFIYYVAGYNLRHTPVGFRLAASHRTRHLQSNERSPPPAVGLRITRCREFSTTPLPNSNSNPFRESDGRPQFRSLPPPPAWQP
jgi:sterol desaturase/sphingolipid hydroxylase (fatty acid hydroxylase superfamily)